MAYAAPPINGGLLKPSKALQRYKKISEIIAPFSLNTEKINSIVLRKLSVFRRLAASRNRCNFAVEKEIPIMKELKIETKRGVLMAKS